MGRLREPVRRTCRAGMPGVVARHGRSRGRQRNRLTFRLLVPGASTWGDSDNRILGQRRHCIHFGVASATPPTWAVPPWGDIG